MEWGWDRGQDGGQHTVLRVALIAGLRVIALLRVHELLLLLLLLLLLHAEVLLLLLLLLRHSLWHLHLHRGRASSEGDDGYSS